MFIPSVALVERTHKMSAQRMVFVLDEALAVVNAKKENFTVFWGGHHVYVAAKEMTSI